MILQVDCKILEQTVFAYDNKCELRKWIYLKKRNFGLEIFASFFIKGYSERKEFAPSGSKFFPLKVASIF